MGQISRCMRRIVCGFIKLYRYFFSYALGPSCRFFPSCFEYALTAVTEKGVLRGGVLTCWRLLRCHPGSPGGYDPVLPDKETS